jgi:hypothetical protein
LKGIHNSRLDLYFAQDGPLGMNEQLTIQNSHTGHFTELSNVVVVSRLTVRAARIAASGGHLKVIKGNIAATIFSFVPLRPAQKRDATNPAIRRKIYSFWRHQVHEKRMTYYSAGDKLIRWIKSILLCRFNSTR